jgi:AraC-like DNA-binding protein
LAKIAVALKDALAQRRADGAPGRTTPRVIARGSGWTVADVVCTCGPQDRGYEERHAYYTIAVVLAGSFQYRSPLGHGLMTPGSLMLGNEGQCYECAHQHGEGDLCVSFWYAAEYFDRLAADAGTRAHCRQFTVPRLPPLAPLSPLVARVAAGAAMTAAADWEHLAMDLAVRTMGLTTGASPARPSPPANAEARISRAVRLIDRCWEAALTLPHLSRAAGLSPYHFLRTFERVTGLTPHQYLRRARLRHAAARLIAEPEKVLDVALDSGFGDVSNFNRAFRAEFGVSPRAFRHASEASTIECAARRSPNAFTRGRSDPHRDRPDRSR